MARAGRGPRQRSRRLAGPGVSKTESISFFTTLG